MVDNVFTAVSTALVTILRNNITDPRTGRTENWIYPVKPKKVAVMPRIEVSNLSAVSRVRALGTTDHIYTFQTQITIWVRMKEIHGNRSNSELCEYLAGLVVDVFETKKTTLSQSYNIKNPLLAGATPVLVDEELQIFTKALTIEFEYIHLQT